MRIYDNDQLDAMKAKASADCLQRVVRSPERQQLTAMWEVLIEMARRDGYHQGRQDESDAAMYLRDRKTKTFDPWKAYTRRRWRNYNRFMAQYGRKPEPLDS